MKNKTIRINYSPHDKQKEIHQDPSRFRVVSCGRRFGKTYFAIVEAFQILWDVFKKEKRKARGWVVAPTFPLVNEDWRVAEQILGPVITHKTVNPMRMEFGEIGELEFKSADREDEGLRGAGLDCCILDEASRIGRKAWEYALRPALADRQGRAVFISTPKGTGNLFFELFVAGRNGERNYKSWQAPSITNPYFPKEEWEYILKNTPSLVLKQEWYAQFLEDESSVFGNLKECLFDGKLTRKAHPRGKYVFGVDLAEDRDFFVMCGIDKYTKTVIDLHRSQKTGWAYKKKLMKEKALYYKGASNKTAKLIVDATGLGDPIVEDLHKAGISTEGFKFSNTSKQELIEGLMLAIEQGQIKIPDCEETRWLLDELRIFEFEVTKTGKIRYQAPEGKHDDGVIALALAVRGLGSFKYKDKDYPKEKPPEEGNTFKKVQASLKKYRHLIGIKGNGNFTSTEVYQRALGYK